MEKTTKNTAIPTEITSVIEALEKGGYEAYLIGGCVRDLLLGRTPRDWDVTTNATPEEIIPLFPKTFYENDFGTVGVVNEETGDERLRVVEVTPYRLETGYSDFRHPDEVKFSTKLEDDLKRRDFTINAIAVSLSNGAIKDIVDLYGGFKDIKDKIVRTVLNPNDRFTEDALRIIRAIRLATELGFTINNDTEMAIQSHTKLLPKISAERIRDEFIKVIMSKEPKRGIELLEKTGILQVIIPELVSGKGVEQNQAHAYDVWEHLLRTLQHAANKEWPLDIRLSALFHDISKPETRRFSHETKQYTFYGHEVVGSRVTKKVLGRLKFPTKTVEKVTKLIRWHMFFSDTETISLSAVRRMINNVGVENIWDLMNVRICDRIGTGRPKENPYRLRKYKAMIEEAMRDPISVKMLKIDGKRLMEVTHETPGPKIGYVLSALLEEVLENPKLNTNEYLDKRGAELIKLPESDLKKLGEEAKEKKDGKEEENIEEIRKKYHVS
ncbi:MAG: CCA tRNA nucleotidyltransferase [bacterium]|nr:CCA tRNA nucleotidyltransferase [bacterium]